MLAGHFKARLRKKKLHQMAFLALAYYGMHHEEYSSPPFLL